MKTGLKGLEIKVQSPNEAVDINFRIEEVSFEANAQELAEIYRHTRELAKMIIDEVKTGLNEYYKHETKMETLRTDNAMEYENLKTDNAVKIEKLRKELEK